MANNTVYKYTKIADLREGNRDVHIYGIVKYYREPIITSTGQYNAIYTLFDESIKDSLEESLRCNIFADSVDKLPQVTNIGDVVRFHRVFIKHFNGRLQLQANRKAYSWIVFPKDNIDEPISSHPNFTLTNKDKQTVRQLKQIWETSGCLVEGLSRVTLLKDLQLNTYTDCIVKVIRIHKFESDPNHCVIRVSDGTKVCYSSYRQTGEIRNDPPWTLCNGGDLLNSTMNHSYDISLFDEHVLVLSDLKVGDYLVMSNLHVKSVVENDFFKSVKEELKLAEVEGCQEWAELIIHSGRSFNRGVLVTDVTKNKHAKEIETRIQELLAEYQKHKQPFIDTNMRPLQDSLTTTDYPYQPFVSIETVHKACVPNKHRIRGRLIAIKPTKVTDMIARVCNNCNEIFLYLERGECLCPKCPDSELVVRYFFEMLVEDDTGLIRVEVFGREGEYLLNNISPEMLINDRALMENIEMKFEKVLDTEYNPKDSHKIATLPWIELCLLSFTGGTDCITYSVFGTSLI